jgi:hypothetical protein
MGLTMVSPFAAASAGATTIALSTIIWLIVVQWVSAGIGGYVTGRMRTRWTATHSDEVFFRDTAHGFLTWAIATVLLAALAGSVVSGVVGTGAQIVGHVAGGAATGAADAAKSVADPTAYFVDALYRPAPSSAAGGASAPAPTAATPPASGATSAADRDALRAETTRIVVRGMSGDTFPQEDRDYLATLVARQTGMTDEAARARVDSVLQGLNEAKVDAQEAADTARKAAATLAVVAFISLLVGAFIASVAAALGGSHRDEQDALVVAR